MAQRLSTVKVKFKDGFKLINEADFDPEKHEKFEAKAAKEPKKTADKQPGKGSEKEPQKDPEKDPEKESGATFGSYSVEEKGGGYFNVVNTATQEVQNEKGLREEAAVALAKELAAKEDN